MNVEIGTEAVLFPEKEYINGFSLQCDKTNYMTRGEFAHFLVILPVVFLSVVHADFFSQKRSPQYSNCQKKVKNRYRPGRFGQAFRLYYPANCVQIPKEVISELKRESQFVSKEIKEFI
jgi:hypothetical protein